MEDNFWWANILGGCSNCWINDQMIPREGEFHKCIFSNLKTVNIEIFANHEGMYIEDKALTSLQNYGSIYTWN